MPKKIYITDNQRKFIAEQIDVPNKSSEGIIAYFYSLPEELLEKHYRDYRYVAEGFDFDCVNVARLIMESSEVNLSADEIRKIIIDKFHLDPSMVVVQKPRDGFDVEIIVYVADVESNVQDVIDEVSKYGFFNSITQPLYRKNGHNYVSVQFESNHDKPLREDKFRGLKLIHITPEGNVASILKNGFLPSCKNKFFSYPPRVYFLMDGGLGLKSIFELAENLLLASGERGPKDVGFLLLDRKKIPQNIRFFADPNCRNGVYTTDIILPNCIISCRTEKIQVVDDVEEWLKSQENQSLA